MTYNFQRIQNWFTNLPWYIHMFSCSAQNILPLLCNWKGDVTVHFSGWATLCVMGVLGQDIPCQFMIQKIASFLKKQISFALCKSRMIWFCCCVEQLSQTFHTNKQQTSHHLFFAPEDSAELIKKQLCCLQKLPFPIHLNLSALFHFFSELWLPRQYTRSYSQLCLFF